MTNCALHALYRRATPTEDCSRCTMGQKEPKTYREHRHGDDDDDGAGGDVGDGDGDGEGKGVDADVMGG